MDSRFLPLPVRHLDIGQPAEPAIDQAAPAPQTDESRYRAKATEAAVKFDAKRFLADPAKEGSSASTIAGAVSSGSASTTRRCDAIAAGSSPSSRKIDVASS